MMDRGTRMRIVDARPTAPPLSTVATHPQACTIERAERPPIWAYSKQTLTHLAIGAMSDIRFAGSRQLSSS
jgi:hypothetical protein